MNNIEIALSFARLHVLHISIIESNKLENIISKLREEYSKEQIPFLINFVNYYHLYAAIVKNNFIIFKIHIPFLDDFYKLFHMYSTY